MISQVSDLLKLNQYVGIWMYCNFFSLYARCSSVIYFSKDVGCFCSDASLVRTRIRTDEFVLNQHIKHQSRSWRHLLSLWYIWIHAHEYICSGVLLQGRILFAIMTDVDHLQTQMWTCESLDLFRNKGTSFHDLH